MTKFRVLLLAILVPAHLLVFPITALAAKGTVVTGGTSALSFKSATAIVATGGTVATTAIVKESFWGTLGGVLIAAGGIAIGVIDPPGGTFFTGAFEVHYPNDLMEPVFAGWLGSWGENSGLPPPPVDPNDWGDPGNPTVFTMQVPNSGLTATFTDNLNGLQSVTFDWGPSGHDELSPSAFNFFATKFEVTADVLAEYLGDAAAPLPGANFFVSVSGPGVQCLPPPPDDQQITTCGESTTSYYRVTTVPEPSILIMIGTGLIAGFRNTRQRRKDMTS